MVLLLVIRQIGFLMAGQGEPREVNFDVASDGLEIGSAIPEEVIQAVPTWRSGPAYLLLLSATCAPCRAVAAGLEQGALSDYTILALVPGPEGLASELIEMLPKGLQTIRDPEAEYLASKMELRSAPFAFQLERGAVTGKAYLHEAGDLVRLINARGKPLVRDDSGRVVIDTREAMTHGD